MEPEGVGGGSHGLSLYGVLSPVYDMVTTRVKRVERKFPGEDFTDELGGTREMKR